MNIRIYDQDGILQQQGGAGSPITVEQAIHVQVQEVPAGGVASVVFNITSPYCLAELDIIADGADALLMQFNDDTADVDYISWQSSINDSVAPNSAFFDTAEGIVLLITNNNAAANLFGSGKVTLVNPLNIVANRTVNYTAVRPSAGAAAGDGYITQGGGFWKNTQGVFKITLLIFGGGNILEGSTFVLRTYEFPA